MKGIVRMTVMLALVGALIAPAAASANGTDRALAQERYYSSYGEPAATQTRTVTVEKDNSAWKALAIGAGALVLVLGAAEIVTLGRLRGQRATT
jgi:hypothetical protein